MHTHIANYSENEKQNTTENLNIPTVWNDLKYLFQINQLEWHIESIS